MPSKKTSTDELPRIYKRLSPEQNQRVVDEVVRFLKLKKEFYRSRVKPSELSKIVSS